MIVWINRERAGYHSFASFLAKVGLVQDASCHCGHTMQDLDHIIWLCPNCFGNRITMINQLIKYHIKSPYAIKQFLRDPIIKPLKIINNYIKTNNKRI